MEDEFYVVYTGAEKIDLTHKRKPLLALTNRALAEEILERYKPHGEIEVVDIEGVMKLIDEGAFDREHP